MKELTEVMGYKFKNSKLLERALTHSSYSKENYERLEFLGDSILDFVVGDYLFSRVDESEGKLSKLRASFVSEQYLHKIFDELKISSYVKLGKSYKSELTKSVKADIFEAIVAGIYLDGGLEEAKKFIISTLKLGNYKTIKNTDYKSQIQEYYQALDKKNKITYKSKPVKTINQKTALYSLCVTSCLLVSATVNPLFMIVPAIPLNIANIPTNP